MVLSDSLCCKSPSFGPLAFQIHIFVMLSDGHVCCIIELVSVLGGPELLHHCLLENNYLGDLRC